MGPLLTIIIPVFLGLRETQRCIEGVLSARCDTAHEVVVIDDASPDAAISTWLRTVEFGGRIHLVVHSENRGFVASANEGMRLAQGRDVVLLNSDTEVADGWLDRLVACAHREPQAGTVTPFSSNATIASYPRPHVANALPAGLDTKALDRLFARTNAGVAIEIPTAVGFCMLITGECRMAVGGFDEEAFGRGYGEEVDFCMRASCAGFRHLLAADVFVYHEGEVSFQDAGAARREAAQRIIDERYPEFQALLREYLERDPARPSRRAVDQARLVTSPRPRVLLVSHRYGGGVQSHVRSLAALVAGDCEALLLQPGEAGTATLSWLREGEEFQAWFAVPGEWADLLGLLRALGVARVHFHHVHGLPEQVLDLAAALGVGYDVTLHDFLPICPLHHLADESGRYCGEPDESGCRSCLAKRPAAWPLDIVDWRARFEAWLRAAQRVIAPSRDLAERVKRRMPGVEIAIWPHFEVVPAVMPVHRVAVLGGISALKGVEVLSACVEDARARALPLHFHVIGHVDQVIALWPQAPLTVGGSYPEGRLDELIARERIDAILFLSQVPESFSYTLSAALRSKLPIVAPEFGAFPERLRDHPAATLLPWDAGAARVNDALLARLKPVSRPIAAVANSR